MTRRFGVLVFALMLAFINLGLAQGRRGGGVAPQTGPSLTELPVIGIANVTFKVTDLTKARSYYQGILGFAEAFDIKDRSGKVTSAYFKVNDDQYVEIMPTLKPGELNREERVVFQSTDLEKLHGLYESRGLNPGKIQKGPDGNPIFRVVSPEGNNLDFLQYADGSEQAKARGKFLSADRISTHLWHAGIMTKDSAASGPFYRDKLGFTNLRFAGTRGDYIETPARDSNTETKNPPLADTPATHDQYEREQWGAVNHIAIEVPDMRAARDLLQKRGGFDDLRVRAHVGNNRHWLMFLFDPAGTRTEIMETPIQDLPAMTVMTPGAGTPIVPKTPGVLPWPSADNPPPNPPQQAAQRGGGGGGRYVEPDPINFNDHAGWVAMFDGATLKGWDGPMDLWHVENGAIVVQSKSNPQTPSTYLLWQGGEPKDFEFKTEVKLEGAGANSGVQFRANKLGEVAGNPLSKWEARGYQADLDNMNSNTGALIECCAGMRRPGLSPVRPDRAFRGQVVRTAVSEGSKPTLLATLDDPDTLKAYWKVGDWNQLHLIARGRTMMLFINGHLMSVLIDDNPTKFADHGVLGIQLEGRGDNKASFRNLWLKNLP